jgi:hypothetical protein
MSSGGVFAGFAFDERLKQYGMVVEGRDRTTHMLAAATKDWCKTGNIDPV